MASAARAGKRRCDTVTMTTSTLPDGIEPLLRDGLAALGLDADALSAPLLAYL